MKPNLKWLLCIILMFGCLVAFANVVRAKDIAIVALGGSGEVAFIDVENARVLKSVPLKDRASIPNRVAITPDGETAIVTCIPGYLSFFDVKKMKCVKTLELLTGPEDTGSSRPKRPNEFDDVAVTPDGTTALVTEHNEEGEIFIVDVAAMKELPDKHLFVGDEPSTVIVKPDGMEAYVLDNGDVHILRLVAGAWTYDTTIPEPCGPEIEDFDLTPDGSRAILMDLDNRIYLVDTSAWNILNMVVVEDRTTEPLQVAVSPVVDGDGNVMAILTNATDQSITVVTIGADNTMSYETPIDVFCSPDGVAFTPDGQTAVVACPNTSEVKIIDVATETVTTISKGLGLAPVGVAIVDVPK